MRVFVLALCVTGCGFSTSSSTVTDASTTDGEVPVDAVLCAGTPVNVCVDPPPTDMVTLNAQQIDTSTSELCEPYTSTPAISACVIAAKSISIPGGNKITVVGSKPLILLAETIRVVGNIDAASHRGGTTGPAADAGCMTGFTDPTEGVNGDGGGGWGGSFGGAGGAGGNGGNTGLGGIPPSMAPSTSLRGGCAGAKGAGGSGGAAGHGGGAVALIAKQTLTIDGVVNASGAAGNGATQNGDGDGGGGGGSGGMIVLDGETVNVNGQCYANGGGGGEGGNAQADGNPGLESTAPDVAGAGGSGGTDYGGDGGNGAVGTMRNGAKGANGETSAFERGGGGGGGSSGVIKVHATTMTGTDDLTKVSPPPT